MSVGLTMTDRDLTIPDSPHSRSHIDNKNYLLVIGIHSKPRNVNVGTHVGDRVTFTITVRHNRKRMGIR